MRSEAYFSLDRRYRYWLLRQWDASKPVFCVVGVNPSTADEEKDDPTIRRDLGFADRLGYGALLKLNVGAFRSTDPKKWRKAEDPIGKENTAFDLLVYIQQFNAKCVVAAWGKNGTYAKPQCADIVQVFEAANVPLWCWGYNSDLTPVHPLMIAYTRPLVRYSMAGVSIPVVGR
jgi:hypothetical protein